MTSLMLQMSRHRSTHRGPFDKKAWVAALCTTLAGVVAAATPCVAQSPSYEQVHAAQNPLADMISVPFQNNTYFNEGPYKKTADVLLTEPIVPVKLNDEWNLITRWITPLVYEPRLSPVDGSEFGLGNLEPQFYLSPAHPGKIIWGLGTELYLPTATNKDLNLGVNRMGGGPAAGALTIQGPWIMGVIVNNVWAGSARERVSLLTVNPLAYFNVEGGWYLTYSPVITSNWVAKSNDRWSVPVGGGFGRVFKIGGQAVNARMQGLYNVVRPDFAPSWQLQLQIQLLFAKK